METSKRNASEKVVRKNDSNMQNEIYNKQDKKCNIWLEQNLTPRKTSAIISMIEQMV